MTIIKNKKMQKFICIAGGVGPLAGVDFHKKIIAHSTGITKDQDHLNVLHLSFPKLIPDRTDFIGGQESINPGIAMANLIQSFVHKEADFVIGIPCNTFHHPSIMGAFRERIENYYPSVIIIDMIQETLEYIKKQANVYKKVGLLSTTGTRKSNIYFVDSQMFEIVQLPIEEQAALQDIIYNKDWGLKVDSSISRKAKDKLIDCMLSLKGRGAEAVILGCTELPLVFPDLKYKDITLIDPALILAKKLIDCALFNG